MIVQSINLKNYRNIRDINIDLNSGTNIIYGDNAQGKTNLLESIYLCATGRSHRTSHDSELIAFDESNAFIKLTVVDDLERTDTINIHLKKGSKKGIAINGLTLKKTGDLLGVLNVVMFSPEDLQLIKNGPGQRRRFMDMELCQISRVYYYNLNQYHKILKQRNNLLKNIKGQEGTLDIWDIQLAEFGKKLIKARKNFILELSEIAGSIHGSITEGRESLTLKYNPSVEIENFEEKLKKNRERDIYYGTTTIGPHKDDILFFINGVNVRDYGSQGQQRTACLAVKMAEIDLIKQHKNVNPVLLLDDVLSELDKTRQNYLINSIRDVQTVITCPVLDKALMTMGEKSKIFNVFQGKVLAKN